MPICRAQLCYVNTNNVLNDLYVYKLIQVARLLQTDGAAGWVIFGQNWKLEWGDNILRT